MQKIHHANVASQYHPLQLTFFFIFLALTEHENVRLENGKYEKLQQISVSFHLDIFLPILGFEYSNLIAGHYLVLNTNTFKSSWGRFNSG